MEANKIILDCNPKSNNWVTELFIEEFEPEEEVYFQPESHRGLAFPKDNFMRTQIEFNGESYE